MASGGSQPDAPLLDRLIVGSGQADDILATESLALGGEEAYKQAENLDHALSWGGMPELLGLTPLERRDWLRSYTNTYLELDMSDLARIDDLGPFRRFLSLAALRSGQLLSYADLARDAAVSPGTARNYLNYLTLSYQTFLLHPYFGSRTKRLVKSPKLYWVDTGLYRQQTGYWGGVSGSLFETFVVGECYKWIKTIRPEVEMWFYRTHGGLEVDLLISTADGMWGIEVKASQQVNRSMFSSLRRLSGQIGVPWRGGLVVYLGDFIQQVGQNLWAVPASRLFG
jgi:predicted AAA+ superfamily ATPase